MVSVGGVFGSEGGLGTWEKIQKSTVTLGKPLHIRIPELEKKKKSISEQLELLSKAIKERETKINALRGVLALG